MTVDCVEYWIICRLQWSSGNIVAVVRDPGIEFHCCMVFIMTATAIYSLQHGCTLSAVLRSTQLPTFHGMVKYNNNKWWWWIQMVAANISRLRMYVGWFGLRIGNQLVLSMQSSNESGVLSHCLCHYDSPIDTIVMLLLLLLLTFVIVWLSSRECWVGGEPWNDRGDHQLPQGATFVSADVAEVPQEPERDPWRTPVQWTVCFQCFCDSLALFLDIYSHSLGGCGNGLACPVGCMCVCLCMCDVCLMC